MLLTRFIHVSYTFCTLLLSCVLGDCLTNGYTSALRGYIGLESHRCLVRKDPPTVKGDRVRFRVTDAFLPGAEELAPLTTSDSSLEGTVVDFSDSGPQTRYFAVVDVVTRYAVVVPVTKLEVIGQLK